MTTQHTAMSTTLMKQPPNSRGSSPQTAAQSTWGSTTPTSARAAAETASASRPKSLIGTVSSSPTWDICLPVSAEPGLPCKYLAHSLEISSLYANTPQVDLRSDMAWQRRNRYHGRRERKGVCRIHHTHWTWLFSCRRCIFWNYDYLKLRRRGRRTAAKRRLQHHRRQPSKLRDRVQF